MDSILRRFENRREIIGENDKENQKIILNTLSYSLNLCLGYLWNYWAEETVDEEIIRKKIIDFFKEEKKSNKTFEDNGKKINLDGKELTEGSKNIIISFLFNACKKSGEIKELLFNSDEAIEQFWKLIKIRNKYAHSFVSTGDSEEMLLKNIESTNARIPLLGEEFSLVVFTEYNRISQRYIAWEYDSDGSLPKSISVSPKNVKRKGEYIESDFPRTYLKYNGTYYKLSPFVHIVPRTDQFLVLNQMLNVELGMIKLSNIFPQGNINDLLYSKLSFPEFKVSGLQKNKNIVIKPQTGVVVSSFTPNYIEEAYVEDITGIEGRIKEHIYGNKALSSVITTIWGHGGVGKTACVQHIIGELLKDEDSLYDHIVFASAKDREFDTDLGKIKEIDNPVKSYRDVLFEINKVLMNGDEDDFDEEDVEDIIRGYGTNGENKKILIVIDDFETFDDDEKTKIINLFSQARASFVKVLITTRNKQIVAGNEISVNELDIESSIRFIKSYISKIANIEGTSGSVQKKLDKLFSDDTEDADEKKQLIFNATKGRLILLHHVSKELINNGCEFNNEIKKFLEDLENNPNVTEFLYGRAFKQMGKDGADAEKVFAVISAIVDEFTLDFNASFLTTLLADKISEMERNRVTEMLELLADSKLIVILDSSNDEIKRAKLFDSKLLTMCDGKYKSSDYAFLRAKIEEEKKENEYNNDEVTAIGQMAVDYIREAVNENKEDINLVRREVAAMRAVPMKVRREAVKKGANSLREKYLSWNEYYKKCLSYSGLEDDEELNWEYVNKLWNRRKDFEECADEAIRHTNYFFEKRERSKDELKPDEHPKMYATQVEYKILRELYKNGFTDENNKLLKRSDDLTKDDLSKLGDLFNDYGRPISENVSKYSDKENKNDAFGRACIAIGKLIVLLRDDKNIRETGEKMCDELIQDKAGKQNPYNISSNYINALVTIKNDLTAKRKLIGKEVVFRVNSFGKSKKGVTSFVNGFTVGDEFKASIHISQVAERKIYNLEKEFKIGKEYKAEVKDISDNGCLVLSTMYYR